MNSDDTLLIVAASKQHLPNALNSLLVDACDVAIKTRGVFTIALSGGSLPSFLSNLNESFSNHGIDPQYDRWHVILADERCVPNEDPENNLNAIRTNFLTKTPIPDAHIYGIDDIQLSKPTEVIASEYEKSVRSVMALSGGYLDLAVLGFGPDGHTCSLFPGHPLLLEKIKLVASIDDSPKPPPRRITLTLTALNSLTRRVVFCGAGESKSPILKDTFSHITFVKDENDSKFYKAVQTTPALYPSGMVNPSIAAHLNENSLTWLVDADAMKGVSVNFSRLSAPML